MKTAAPVLALLGAIGGWILVSRLLRVQNGELPRALLCHAAGLAVVFSGLLLTDLWPVASREIRSVVFRGLVGGSLWYLVWALRSWRR